jgi:YwiC-like protein
VSGGAGDASCCPAGGPTGGPTGGWASGTDVDGVSVLEMIAAADGQTAERAIWRSVAMPSEHGGWGLTLEPVLLGLIVAWSPSGLALGAAAFLAFLVRTPLKLVFVDVRRKRWLDRSRLGLRIAAGELLAIAAAVAVAGSLAGWAWVPLTLVAAPLVAVEVWFDVRSRGRRLLPELCGATGIAAVAAAITIASGKSVKLAVGLWLVLAARSLGAIPFVRVQIQRLRRGRGPVSHSDIAQAASVVVAVAAFIVDRRLAAGLIGVAVLAVLQTVWVRRPPVPAKRLGVRQMAIGLCLVAVTAAGVML